MNNILKEIVEYKKQHVNQNKSQTSIEQIKRQAEQINKEDIFTKAIKEKILAKETAYICEIKKASPSLGDINITIDVAKQAKKYESLGATCLSILTDEKYFKGHDQDIEKAKAVTKLPILRKDFIIDPYQIYESKIIGADAILLIMASLTKTQAQEFEEIALEQGLGVLIESHNEKELEQALELKSPLIGINNRNLKTLEISLDNTIKLSSKVPDQKILISESGINSPQDIEKLKQYGAKGFLIGTSLMKNIMVLR